MEMLRGMGTNRLVAMGVVAAGLIGIFLYLATQVGQPTMALLYGSLDLRDAGEITKRLDTMGVKYELRSDGTQVYVPDDRVLQLRVALAQEGVPAGGSIGYEIFDTTSALGTTSFIQDVNLQRALEGELARTIRAIDSVNQARVHLVLPKRELFSRDTRKASASIVIQTRGSRRLDSGQIAAIQNLVAAAVPDLSPTHISIVDDKGNLLARGTDEAAGPGALAATRMEEVRTAFETRLKGSIEQMLERSLGAGKVWAEISAELDRNSVTTHEEIFNPDGQVVRSTQTIGDTNNTRDNTGPTPVTVATNLPEAAAAGQVGAANTTAAVHNEETVNYEITKKMTQTVTEAGALTRLSVAVLVDGTYTGAAPNETYQPRSQADLDQIAALVRSAVGYDQKRGDQVSVQNMQFARTVELFTPTPTAFLGLGKDDYFRVGELFIFAIVALLVVLLVLKPLVTRALSIAQAQAQAAAAEQAAEAGLIAAQQAALSAPEESVPVSEMEQMIDMAQVEGRVRSSSLKKIGELVDKHPEEALAILRNWLYQG